MTSMTLKNVVAQGFLKELHSKVNFDNVQEVESKKPEVVVSGLKEKSGNLTDKPQLNGNHYTPIIAEPSNFRKEIGGSMSDEGFVKLPRKLLTDPNWKGLRVKYQRLFLIILENTSYRLRNFSYNGHSIKINPGQLCISYRRLVDLYNDGVKFKADRIDVPFIQRAVSVFSKFGFSIQESIHDISLISITQRELYEHFQKLTDTPSDTDSIQTRYSNEERKEGKEIEETIDGADALDSSLINLEKEEEQKHPSVFQPETSKQKTGLSTEKQKHFEYLCKFVIENKISVGMTDKPGIKEQDLLTWLKTYDVHEILECLKLAIKATITRTYGGYVTKVLKDRIPKREEDSKQGRKFVEDFIKQNRLKHIDLKKDYFKDLISNEQNYYHLPIQTIEAILKRSKDRAKEREEEEKREREQEDY